MPDDERLSTRVSVQVESGIYRFGAITGSASIPERRIPLKHWLVEAANSELATESDPVLQLDRGQFLGHLLIPEDLRPQFFTRDPLVLMLDATTARIHWEMMAQIGSGVFAGRVANRKRPAGPLGTVSGGVLSGHGEGADSPASDDLRAPPEPPPPPRRVLRVLVVADPAADAPLPGAMEEGTEVADLFESFNAVYAGWENRVEVVRLIGPARATATNVLREVMSRPYDVFHFAGHCFFDAENPAASGLVFSGGQVLSADLLSRIDRVPKFVFSNACESGVTPDRPEEFSRDLAPSFAESFFQKGVSNFICTAWPVDDLAAPPVCPPAVPGTAGSFLPGRPAWANRESGGLRTHVPGDAGVSAGDRPQHQRIVQPSGPAHLGCLSALWRPVLPVLPGHRGPVGFFSFFDVGRLSLRLRPYEVQTLSNRSRIRIPPNEVHPWRTRRSCSVSTATSRSAA